MRFELDDDLVAVRDLTERIVTDHATVDRVRHVEQAEGGFDRELWTTLAEAGIIGSPLPESVGGAGLGMLGLVTVLEQQGRRVAPVPLWTVLATAALPIAEFGSAAQRDRWLPGLLAGSTLVTGAFEAAPGETAAVSATAEGDGWRLHGELPVVPAAEVADGIVLPARLDDGGVVVVVVPADAAGLAVTPVRVTGQDSAAAVALDGVPVAGGDALPGDGAAIARWTLRRARVALAGLQLGVCAEALRMTAAYTSQRVQFGRPLSTNQAVSLRAADTYLDVESIRLTTQRAAWLLDSGAEDAADAAALVAKWWAARAGLRAVHATQHLHGGIGADIDYPIHRYFLWGRQLAFTLGGADAIAAELGDALEHGGAIGVPA